MCIMFQFCSSDMMLTQFFVYMQLLRILFGCQEALRSRGLRDDTTCLVVDVAPRGPQSFAPAVKKQISFMRLLRCKSVKGGHVTSDLTIMEELFEENSAALAER